MLPRLSAVLERIWSDLVAGDLPMNTGVTLYRALTGFAIAALSGIRTAPRVPCSRSEGSRT